jgi:O-antigen/teichoic acid export membrane protein
MAEAALLANFFETFRDLGTGSALIREKELSPSIVASVFWLNVILGTVICLAVVGLSYPLSIFFHEPALAPVVRVLALALLFSCLSVVPNALLNRQMAFKRITIAQLVGAACGTALAITLAISGAGVWSLVLGTVTISAVTCIALWIAAGYRVNGALVWRDIRGIAHYSLHLSAFGTLNYFSRNADNLIVGRWLGTLALGYYQMAYTIMTYPLNNFSSAICTVLFPAISRLQDDDERFRSAYTRACMLIALVTFPAMLGVAIVARPFVEVVLGPSWTPVVGLLVVFGPLGMAQSVFTTVGLIYKAKGRSDWLFRWGLFSSIAYVASFLLGVRWGIQGVANAYAVAWTALMIPGFLIPLRLIGLSGREFFLSLWPGLKASLAMALISVAWLQSIRMGGVKSPWIQLFSTALLGGLVYIVLLLRGRPPVVIAVRDLLMESGKAPLARLAKLI